MSVVTAFRTQAPLAAPVPAAKPDAANRAPVEGTSRPVAAPERKDAPAQPAATAASVTTHLAERDESRHPAAEARQAAEAAREAYIQASIAAGVSPLPLP